jgi:hypothetical protein
VIFIAIFGIFTSSLDTFLFVSLGIIGWFLFLVGGFICAPCGVHDQKVVVLE